MDNWWRAHLIGKNERGGVLVLSVAIPGDTYQICGGYAGASHNNIDAALKIAQSVIDVRGPKTEIKLSRWMRDAHIATCIKSGENPWIKG